MWTSEAVQELIRLAPDTSAAEIGSRLGFSKNAVIGKANRLGIPINTNHPNSGRKFENGQPRASRAKPPLRAHQPAKPRPAGVFIPVEVLMREPIPAGAVAFIDAEPGQCRWFQEGQKGAFGLICAQRTLDEKSYCQAHYLRSLDSASRSEAIARLNIRCEAVAA